MEHTPIESVYIMRQVRFPWTPSRAEPKSRWVRQAAGGDESILEPPDQVMALLQVS